MTYLDSRRFHLDRFLDLMGPGGANLRLGPRVALLFDHAMGIIWPLKGGRV